LSLRRGNSSTKKGKKGSRRETKSSGFLKVNTLRGLAEKKNGERMERKRKGTGPLGEKEKG